MSDELKYYFICFDDVRSVAKEWIANWRVTHPKLAKKFGIGVWENSSFYVGRGTTSLKLWGIAIPYMACISLSKELQRRFPEYRVVMSDHFREMRIYIN